MSEEKRLRVDPTRCVAVGICSHFAADLVRIDRWGYPMISAGPLSARDERRARAAARACPRRALFIEARDTP